MTQGSYLQNRRNQYGGKESTMKRERSQRTQAEKPVEFKQFADAHEKSTSFTRSLSKVIKSVLHTADVLQNKK